VNDFYKYPSMRGIISALIKHEGVEVCKYVNNAIAESVHFTGAQMSFAALFLQLS
jgi:hypothetical protein